MALLLYGDTQRSPQFRNKKRHSEIKIAPTACACAMCVSVIKQGASTHEVPCGPLIFDLNVTSLIVLLVTRWFNRCLLFFLKFILRIETFLCDTMTYFTTWEDFAKAAEMLYVNDPMKVLQTAERGPYMRNADCIADALNDVDVDVERVYRAFSLPGQFAPWPFRPPAFSLTGTKVLWNFRSVELSFPGIFAPSMCLSLCTFAVLHLHSPLLLNAKTIITKSKKSNVMGVNALIKYQITSKTLCSA